MMPGDPMMRMYALDTGSENMSEVLEYGGHEQVGPIWLSF